MIISILANGAPFKWVSTVEIDQCFKTKTFKLYRKTVKRTSNLHSKMAFTLNGLYSEGVMSRKVSKALLLESSSTQSTGLNPQHLGRFKHEVSSDASGELNSFLEKP